MPDQPVIGTPEEQKAFIEVHGHYQLAKPDLEQRIIDFDKKDILFRSHIVEQNWPYSAMVFDPRIFTALFEKTARTFVNKPRGRMIPREGGDALGAQINNELLSWQWDDNERVDNTPMLAKWAMMDLNARKYGASFALDKWHWQRQIIRDDNEQKSSGKSITFFDGPNFKPLSNRDCLPNPSYSTIKNWFQHRDYVTFQELADINDAARSKPIYKNLDFLRQALKEEAKKGGDTRESNYISKNKAIKGLTDYLGQDEVYKTIEIITEYRPDRWITFAPKHGILLRDMPNPYKHGQIPIVMLKYYPVDDDLYGLSEIEPVERLQRAVNSLINQYLDAVNMSLYAPLKIRSTGGAVQLHTIEFGPAKKWMMSDPATDVITHDQNISGVTEFASTYRFMISAMQEALGETSQGISNLAPGGADKTATEIRDLAISRNARDSFNQIFLSEAMKKQMMFWHKINQQFLFSNPAERTKVIRIVGKDAIKYFQRMGLDGEGLTDESIEKLSDPELADIVQPQDLMQPIFPVKSANNVIPKFVVDSDNQFGELILEPEDLAGNYDYIPDVESMKLPDNNQIVAATKQLVEVALNPQTTQILAQEGYKIKAKDVIEDFFEKVGIKDADKYFERFSQMEGGMNGQIQTGVPINGAGAASSQGGSANLVNGQLGGVQTGVPSLA